MLLLEDRPPVASPLVADPYRPARRVAVGVAMVLLATALALAVWLPADAVVTHWSLAWAGLDVATATTALTTAALLRTGDRRAALTASAGAALLVLDAWFDVTTAAAGAAFDLALGEAVLLELPLAVLAVHLALRLLGSRPGGAGWARTDG